MADDQGEATNAVSSVAQALQEWQSAHAAFGPQHESTLAALLTLATARRNAGDHDGAVRDAGEVLVARRQTLGAEHPDTLALATLVANWRFNLGDAGAVDTLRELVPVMTRILGDEHRDTLWARHTLAVAEDAVEDPARRLLRWVQLCGAETRVFGVRHELTLSAAYGVAVARHDLGDPFGASSDALVVEGYRRGLLGLHHPDTLAAKLSRLTWRGEAMGATADVLDGLDELIPDMQDALGHDHPHTLLARYTRAAWTSQSANEVERISEWEPLVEDLARVLGEQNALTVAGRAKVTECQAEWEGSLNDTREIAFDLYVDMESEDRGIEVPPGREWLDPGNLEGAALDKVVDDADEQRSSRAELMEHAIAVKKALSQSARALGNDAYETLRWRYYLAYWLWYGHEFEPAGERTRRLIADCVRVLGEDDPLTAASRELLSNIEAQVWGGLSPFWDGSAQVRG